MPELTLLTWNIETLGPGKMGKYEEDDWGMPQPYDLAKVPAVQKAAILETIGQTVDWTGADIVSVIELAGSLAWAFRELFLEAVQGATGVLWDVVMVDSKKQDMYFIGYRKDRRIDILCDANRQPVAGLTEHRADGRRLVFAAAKNGGKGRVPAYFTFQTLPDPQTGDAGGRLLTVICYHACKGGNNQGQGVQNVAFVAPVTQVEVDGAVRQVDVSVVSGDFNTDYLSFPWYYENVTDATADWTAIPAAAPANGNNTRTSLVTFDPAVANPPIANPTPLDFRVNAYDNIFAHNSQFTESAVLDMVADFVNPPPGARLTPLQTCAGKFNLIDINARIGRSRARAKIGLVGTFPPQNPTDAWRIYRRVVSNHLPVWGTFEV